MVLAIGPIEFVVSSTAIKPIVRVAAAQLIVSGGRSLVVALVGSGPDDARRRDRNRQRRRGAAAVAVVDGVDEIVDRRIEGRCHSELRGVRSVGETAVVIEDEIAPSACKSV